MIKRKIAVLIAAIVALTVGFGVGGAQANASYGEHTVHFSCSVYDQGVHDTYVIAMDMTYNGTSTTSGDVIFGGEETWNTTPAFGANRIQVTFETTPGFFSYFGDSSSGSNSASFGGSSDTLNDIAGHGSRSFNAPFQHFQNTSTPQFHFVAWGVGPGNSTASCGQFVNMP